MAKNLGIKAYIYDGNTADEMDDLPRISGCPLVDKLSMGHFLNTKAVGRMYAESIGKKYEELTLIMVHTGGGISIGLHKNGVIVDVCTDEDGTMSPERSGGLHNYSNSGNKKRQRSYLLLCSAVSIWARRCQYTVGGGPLIRVALEEAYFLIKASSFLRGGEYVW